jgi:hypothetical protein
VGEVLGCFWWVWWPEQQKTWQEFLDRDVIEFTGPYTWPEVTAIIETKLAKHKISHKAVWNRVEGR